MLSFVPCDSWSSDKYCPGVRTCKAGGRRYPAFFASEQLARSLLENHTGLGSSPAPAWSKVLMDPLGRAPSGRPTGLLHPPPRYRNSLPRYLPSYGTTIYNIAGNSHNAKRGQTNLHYIQSAKKKKALTGTDCPFLSRVSGTDLEWDDPNGLGGSRIRDCRLQDWRYG